MDRAPRGALCISQQTIKKKSILISQPMKVTALYQSFSKSINRYFLLLEAMESEWE
jgi:hypothetical protein